MRKRPHRTVSTSIESDDALLLEREAARRRITLTLLMRSILEPVLQTLRPRAEREEPSVPDADA